VLTRVIADAVAEGLMARAGAKANAGADDKPSYDNTPAGQLAGDEPLPDWEKELLTGVTAGAAGTATPAAVEGAGTGESAQPDTAAAETPVEPAAADAAAEPPVA